MGDLNLGGSVVQSESFCSDSTRARAVAGKAVYMKMEEKLIVAVCGAQSCTINPHIFKVTKKRKDLSWGRISEELSIPGKFPKLSISLCYHIPAFLSLAKTSGRSNSTRLVPLKSTLTLAQLLQQIVKFPKLQTPLESFVNPYTATTLRKCRCLALFTK